MNSPQAAGFSFANTDMTKAWADLRLPSLNLGVLLEAIRKNTDALSNACQVVFDGLTTLAQRQGELFKTTVDDCSRATSDVLAGATFEERVTKQADAARHVCFSAVAHFSELSDITVKANVTAVDILNARATDAFDDLRALFAEPAETDMAVTSDIDEPAAVVEESTPAGDVAAPVEPESTATAGPTTAYKKTAAPAASRSRRATSRR
jgi:phasin family protein